MRGREREGKQKKLTTHWDVTVIIKFSGVHCIAPRTIYITIWVSAVLKRDRHFERRLPWGRGGSRYRDINLLEGWKEEGVPLLSSLLAF